MSWSVHAMGKGEAVGRSLAEQFAKIRSYNMPEPEQMIANKVGEICADASAGAPEGGLLIRSDGSAYRHGDRLLSLHLKLEIDLIAFCE